MTVVEQNGISLPEPIRAAAELSDYAVEARYPGPMEPITEDEYKEAIRMADEVVSWVADIVMPVKKDASAKKGPID